jgi:hypothetical protein
MSAPVTAWDAAHFAPAHATHPLPHAASQPQKTSCPPPARRVTIRTSGAGRASQGGAANANGAAHANGVLGAWSAPEPSAAGAAAAATGPLVQSASGGLTLRKRGSGTLGGGFDAVLRVKPSKTQRLLSDDADSGATPAAGQRTSGRRSHHGGAGALLQMQSSMGKPTFVELVTVGAFPPGNYEFTVGTAQGVVATVLPTGAIVYAGEEHHSISAFALAAARSRNPARQACDGWKEVRLAGRKLEAWRDAFLRDEAPPHAPRLGEGAGMAPY